MRFPTSILPFALLALATPVVNTSFASDHVAAQHASSAASAHTPPPALKMAMSAAQVIQILGQPEKIKPMKSEKGKVEVWIYEAPVGERVEQVPIATPIMTSTWGQDGLMHEEKVGDSMEFREVRHSIIERTEVLMFNDHFVTQKATRRENQRVLQ